MAPQAGNTVTFTIPLWLVGLVLLSCMSCVGYGYFYKYQNKELVAILNGTTHMRFSCESALTNCYEELNNAGK